MRAMALAGDKGVGAGRDQGGRCRLSAVGRGPDRPAAPAAELLARQGEAFGGVVDLTLLARLDLKIGDRINVGAAVIELRAELVSEPDKIADGIGFGPRLMVPEEALRATGLLQPGSLVRWTYRIGLRRRAGCRARARSPRRPTGSFRKPGWDIRSRVNAARASPATSSASRSS